MDDWYELVEEKLRKLPGRTGRDMKTQDEVFDRQTVFTLYKLLSRGIIDSLDFPISTGKEANVFRGTTLGGKRVAVKIYRVNTATFRDLMKYVQGDPRFENAKKDQRGLIHTWTQKEFKNLHRMRAAGIDVPEPITALNNILIMEYIGDDEQPAVRLKDSYVEDRYMAEEIYEKVVRDMVLIYRNAGLIHSDLSEFNILMDEGKPRIIDVGQAVLVKHPNSEEFLSRDVRNIARYFNKLGLDVGEEELLKRIKGENEE